MLQDRHAGTSNQTDSVIQEKSPKLIKSNPESLLTLSLKSITNVDLTLNSHHRILHVPRHSPADSNVGSHAMNMMNKTPNIQILENRKVTFDDLLLMRIKAGTSSKTKRKRMATGAEVITRDDVYKITLEKSQKEKKR